MKKTRKPIVIGMAALWMVSLVFAWFSFFTNYNSTKQIFSTAEAANMSAQATVDAIRTYQVTINVLDIPSGATLISIDRVSGSTRITVTSNGQTISGTTATRIDYPGIGTFKYEVSAYATAADLTSKHAIGSIATSPNVTITTIGNAATTLGLTTTNSSGTVTIKYNIVNQNSKTYSWFNINRYPGTLSDVYNGDETSLLDGITVKSAVQDVSVTDTPGDGVWTYFVDAYTSQSNAEAAIADSVSGNSTVTASATNSTVDPNANNSGADVATPLTSAEVEKQCKDQTAQSNSSSTPPTKITTKNLYEAINDDGVKKVYKWVLSFVNLVCLVFLLVLALANIFHFSVDTYAIKKVLPSLLYAVVLANFSWLICRFITEAATVLYNGLITPYGSGGELFKHIAIGYGIDDKSICNTAGGQSFATGLLGVFVGTVLIVIAAILILTLYILLVARIWILTLLFVLAPLAFLSLGFPATQNYFKKWFVMFSNWAFMAPASFLILILADKISIIGSGPNLTRYILTTALLYFAIQVPFKMGGEWMRKWGNYVSQFKKKGVDYTKKGAGTAYKYTGAKAGVDFAKKSYEGYKKEAIDRAKVRLKKTKIGATFGRMAFSTKQRRERLGEGEKRQNMTLEGMALKREIEKDKDVKSAANEARKARLAYIEEQLKNGKFAKETSGLDKANKKIRELEGNRGMTDDQIKRRLQIQRAQSGEEEWSKDELDEKVREQREAWIKDEEETKAEIKGYKDVIGEEGVTNLTELEQATDAADKKLYKAQVAASTKTHVAKMDRLSVKDDLNETLSNIEALYAQNTDSIPVANKRAWWRTFIASNQVQRDARLNESMMNMYLGEEQGDFANVIGKTLEGMPMMTSDVGKMLSTYASRQNVSGVYKEIADSEATKVQHNTMLEAYQFLSSHDRMNGFEHALEEIVDKLEDLKKEKDALPDAEEKHRVAQEDFDTKITAAEAESDKAEADKLKKSKKAAEDEFTQRKAELDQRKTWLDQEHAFWLDKMKEEKNQRDKEAENISKKYGTNDPSMLPQQLKGILTQNAEGKLEFDPKTALGGVVGRKMRDKYRGIYAKYLEGMGAAYSTNKSFADITNDTMGRGNDVKNREMFEDASADNMGAAYASADKMRDVTKARAVVAATRLKSSNVSSADSTRYRNLFISQQMSSARTRLAYARFKRDFPNLEIAQKYKVDGIFKAMNNVKDQSDEAGIRQALMSYSDDRESRTGIETFLKTIDETPMSGKA